MLDRTQEWEEGRVAHSQGIPEGQCPYDMYLQWAKWADWTCGYGEAISQAETDAKNPEAGT